MRSQEEPWPRKAISGVVLFRPEITSIGILTDARQSEKCIQKEETKTFKSLQHSRRHAIYFLFFPPSFFSLVDSQNSGNWLVHSAIMIIIFSLVLCIFLIRDGIFFRMRLRGRNSSHFVFYSYSISLPFVQ